MKSKFEIQQEINRAIHENHIKVMGKVFLKGWPYFILSGLLCWFSAIGLIKLEMLGYINSFVSVLIILSFLFLLVLLMSLIVTKLQRKVMDNWNWTEFNKKCDEILK